MNLVDVLLAVSIATAVGRGWRLGIIRGIFGLAGLLAGGWLALQTAPIAIDAISPSAAWRIATGVGLVAGMAIAGEVVGTTIGGVLRRALRWSPVQFLDSVLGSGFRVSSFAIIVWLLSSAMVVLPDQGVAHLVRTSDIVRFIDEYAPDAAYGATAALRNAMRITRFPVVFAGATPQPQTSARPADPQILRDGAVQATYMSVFKVRADAEACSERMSGTGFMYAPGRILTNAHVVAGANHVTVSSIDSTQHATADVVLFDPSLDVAVLAVKGLVATPLTIGPDLHTGSQAVVPGYTGGGPLSPDAARIADIIIARGHDIYGGATVDREIYVLRAHVAAGDSGAPLVGIDGTVVGMVFAAATDERDTGYALTASSIARVATQGRSSTRAVPLGQCLD